MDEAFLGKSMFTWYKEMLNLDQQVTDETIIIAAQAICEKMGDSSFDISSGWVSKFKDRYGIRTESAGTSSRQISALWRAKRRRKFSEPEPSQELVDKRARFGKSYAIDEDSYEEASVLAQKSKEEPMENKNNDTSGADGSLEDKNAEGDNEEKSESDSDSLCGFSFEELNSVPEYKPHECQDCSERYLWGHQLREHMKCHSDVKTYLCTICGKSYKSPHNLKIHMRVHTGDRPYVCPHCEKGFREQSALVKHIRIHTGERPFLCSDCGSAFISKTQLNIHVKTHHGNSTEKRKNSRASGITKTLSAPETFADHSEYDKDSFPSITSSSQTSGLPEVQQQQHQQHLVPSQLLPGTGFYVPSPSAGSISCGTPMAVAGSISCGTPMANAGSISCGTPIPNVNQHVSKSNTPQPNVVDKQQVNSQLDPVQLQMAQDYINSAAAQAYLYQDNYYNS